jgi:cobalt/nickel transport system ATP-binding protein
MLLVRAIDLSERLYEVLRVRGYRGRIAADGRRQGLCREDALPVGVGIVALSVALLAVALPRVFLAASGYILVAALALLAVALWQFVARGRQTVPATAAVSPGLPVAFAGRSPEALGASARVGSTEAPGVGLRTVRMDDLPHLHVGVDGQDGRATGIERREVARVSCVRHVYPDGTEVSLCGLDFVAHQGEGIVILGPNGAGKSTLLFHLLGLLRPDEGLVVVLGHDPAREFAAIQPRLGVLVQNVEEQLLGPTVADDVAFGARNAGMSAEEVQQRAQRVMRRLGIEHLSGKVVHYLSGGEKRKVALAGALVTDPEILILDEPFEGLDPKSRNELVTLLSDLKREKGLALIVTTHDVDLVPTLADTVYVLAEGGHIIARGTPDEVFRKKEILEVSNIEAPALTLLFHRLRESGLDLGSPIDLEDAARRLLAVIGGEDEGSEAST